MAALRPDARDRPDRPGKVTKLVPFGAFVRVEEGIEGLVHISELAERHVEVPDQVVAVGDDAMVKVIDIDLERRRISLSLKQANEDYIASTSSTRRSYGMADSYDEPATTSSRGLRRRDQRMAGRLRQAAHRMGGPQYAGPSAATRCTPRRWRSSPPPRAAAERPHQRRPSVPARRGVDRRFAGQRRPAGGAAREAAGNAQPSPVAPRTVPGLCRGFALMAE